MDGISLRGGRYTLELDPSTGAYVEGDIVAIEHINWRVVETEQEPELRHYSLPRGLDMLAETRFYAIMDQIPVGHAWEVDHWTLFWPPAEGTKGTRLFRVFLCDHIPNDYEDLQFQLFELQTAYDKWMAVWDGKAVTLNTYPPGGGPKVYADSYGPYTQVFPQTEIAQVLALRGRILTRKQGLWFEAANFDLDPGARSAAPEISIAYREWVI